MKKIFLSTILLAVASLSAMGQKARESNEKSPAGDGNAIIIELEGQQKNVEEVMDKRFTAAVKGGKNEKGFQSWHGVIFSEISNETLDYYFKVEKKSDTQSKIILFISKGYNNFLSSKEDGSTITNAIKLLDGMIAEVRKYELQLAIDAQTKIVTEAEKIQAKLVSENEDLVKEKEKLTKELEENKTNTETNVKTQEDQKKIIEEQKKVLGEFQKKLGEVK